MRQIDFFETDKTVSTVYFGGGTPPILGIERICGLIKALKAKFNLAEDCEITVEVNPAAIDREGLMALRKAGANRLSVGIQSAEEKVLALIGRIHSFAEAVECVNDAKEAGFENISGDIIFALPDQSLEGFKRGVEKIVDTGVNHISAYSLQLEEGTELYRRKDSFEFPDEDSEEAQYDALCRILKEKGFEHYEVSSFCRQGFESKHNLNYWANGEYFGFGAGAYSFFEGRRFSAEADLESFIEKSFISAFAPTDWEKQGEISRKEREEEAIMLGLRTNRGARIPEERFPVAERIAKMGYGKFENGILALNSKGFRVSNEIIAEILV